MAIGENSEREGRGNGEPEGEKKGKRGGSGEREK
jgi:hypothetical protein